MENQLNARTRQEFRQWLTDHAGTERECWVVLKRGRPTGDGSFCYIDAVEEALCFGWIDSVWKNVDGVMWSRFSPRQKKSPWTELNKERVRRLERLGRMTDAGRAVLPDMDFVMDPEVEAALRTAGVWDTFTGFPPLYIRVRSYNLSFARMNHPAEYFKALDHCIRETRRGRMYGEWNDYGRLTESQWDGGDDAV